MQAIPPNFDVHSFFAAFLGDTTPNRRDELNNLLQTSGIRFQLDEVSPGMDFWANSTTKRINIPRRCMFRIKANAFAYFCVVDGLLSKRSGKADAGIDGRLQKANELLTWAVRTEVATFMADNSPFSIGAIPSDIEDLYRRCLKPEHFALGEEIFKMGVAWILHHELAHLRLHHRNPSVRVEYEADQAATDWILKVDGLTELDLFTRQFGIATGLGWLSALNVYIGPGDGTTHPPAARRFVNGIEYMTNGRVDNSELPWLICRMVLLLHAQNAGFPVTPQHMVGSSKDIANNLLQVIETATSSL